MNCCLLCLDVAEAVFCTNPTCQCHLAGYKKEPKAEQEHWLDRLWKKIFTPS